MEGPLNITNVLLYILLYQFENYQTFFYSTQVQISNHRSRLRSVFRPYLKRSLAKLKRRSDYNCQIFALISITLFSETGRVVKLPLQPLEFGPILFKKRVCFCFQRKMSLQFESTFKT